MPNHPYTVLFIEPDGLDALDPHVSVLDDGELVASIKVAPYTSIQTSGGCALAFARKLHDLATEIEQSSIRKLSQAFKAAHPEEPTPIGRGGICGPCGRVAPMLFTARVSLGGAEWDAVEACGSCANVRADLACEFDAATIKIGPEGDDLRAIREEQHDLGMDVLA